MATFSSTTTTLIFYITLFIVSTALTNLTNSQPVLDSVEQESVYRVLESLNSNIPWRSLYPDDLCSSAPHGVVCGYTTLPTSTDPGSVSVSELSFGYVSDHNPNPPCDPNSPGPDPDIFSSLPNLRKLFFYNCFTQKPVSLKSFSRVGSGLEELVFVQNPSLFGSLSDSVSNMTSLRRLVITGTNVSGDIPYGIGDLVNLEEVTLSGNRFTGLVPESVTKVRNLKILDLSQNGFRGNIPAEIGELGKLIKLDLRMNFLGGEFPVSMKGLKSLEFLDLSYNRFSNSGIPLFFGEMSRLKWVYLSGNELGGVIPDIWGKLRGVNGIGLSGVGLVGNIPSSIGVFLGNLTYLALDGNKLTGRVPLEFERLGKLNELNLKNNNLSGRLPFSAKFVARVGGKLKVQGNTELCVDERVFSSFYDINKSLGHLKVCTRVEYPKSALPHVSCSRSVGHQVSSLVVMFLWFLVM